MAISVTLNHVEMTNTLVAKLCDCIFILHEATIILFLYCIYMYAHQTYCTNKHIYFYSVCIVIVSHYVLIVYMTVISCDCYQSTQEL